MVHKGTRSSFGYLRICPDHSGVVPGGSGTYENGNGGSLRSTGIVSVIGGQLKQYVVFTGHINLCPDGSETHLDGSGTFVRGSGRSWKWSRSVRNVPKRSRYVPEGPGSFWKVMEGSG